MEARSKSSEYSIVIVIPQFLTLRSYIICISIINQDHNLEISFFGVMFASSLRGTIKHLIFFNLFYTNQNPKICILFPLFVFCRKKIEQKSKSARKGIFEIFNMEIDLPLWEIDFLCAKFKKI